MKKQLLGMILSIGMVIASAAVSVVPIEAQAQSYRAGRAIARNDVRRARAHRAHRVQRARRADRALARRDIRRVRARRAYRADRAARAYYRGY